MQPRKVKKPLILYGKGQLGALALEIFTELKIPVRAIIDQYSLRPLAHESDAMVASCVATAPYRTIEKALNKAGYPDVSPVWDIVDAYPEVGLHNGFIAPYEKRTSIYDLSRQLSSISSLIFYRHFAYWHVGGEMEPRRLATGYTSLPSTLADIRRRQRVELFADSDMKHITIHNEGHEFETIRQNLNLFLKYRPTLTVACYHNIDGLFNIERFLMKKLVDYDFYFKLYAYMGQAGFFICVPKTDGSYDRMRHYDRQNNILKYKGITRYVDKEGHVNWIAQIKHKSKRIYLGCRSNPVEAAKLYDRKALKILKDKAVLNFPKENYLNENITSNKSSRRRPGDGNNGLVRTTE